LGDIAFKHFYNLALKYFGHAQATGHVYSPVQFEGYNLFNLKVAAESHLSHSIIGMPGYSYHHPDKLALIVLNSILGGPALTARLYQSIREKYGLAYSVDSQLAHYSDTGWLAIYMGTDPELSDKAISLCMKEMKKLREQALGTLQLSRAKQQLIVQLAISHESRMHEALSVGKAWLLKNHANSMAEIIGQIEQISPSKLLEVANEVFDTQKMVTLIYQGEQAQ
jgi:predicted Zn-dependent peptidase